MKTGLFFIILGDRFFFLIKPQSLDGKSINAPYLAWNLPKRKSQGDKRPGHLNMNAMYGGFPFIAW